MGNNEGIEPITLNWVRKCLIAVFLLSAIWVSSRIFVSPDPVILVFIAAMLLASAIGLVRQLTWAYFPTAISLFLFLFSFSALPIMPLEEEKQNFNVVILYLYDLPASALWIYVVGVWFLGLLAFRILCIHSKYFHKKWW